MHFTFIAYGERNEVERLFSEMECQKFYFKMTKEGEKDKGVYIRGQVRYLPFGVMEYVFPKEYLGIILNTMCINKEPNRYNVPEIVRKMIRTALKLKPIPKFQVEQKMIWTTENVSIMPLGIREDAELVEPKDMGYKGWLHESL